MVVCIFFVRLMVVHSHVANFEVSLYVTLRIYNKDTSVKNSFQYKRIE